jgi:hypothetical protein
MRGFPGPGDNLLGLLRIPAVREEIELFPDQEEALRKIGERAFEEIREAGGIDFRGLRNASEEERREAFEKLSEQRRKMERKVREGLEEVLLPGQLERLEEIALQQQGVRALTNSDKVAAALEITADQQSKFESIEDKYREKQREVRSEMREMFATREEPRDRAEIRKAFEEVREKMEQLRKEREKEMLAVLTAEQRQSLNDMKGEPFEMPAAEDRFGRGGPGGFRRGGRGGERDREE